MGLISLCCAIAVDTLTILFAGDLMQHQPQLDNAHIYGTPLNDNYGYDYSDYFKYIAEEVNRADLAVVNMEFTVGVTPFTGYPTFSAPAALAKEAADAGFDIFLCANNHICDKGKRGLRSTLDTYDTLGIEHTGAFRDSRDEIIRNPLIVEIDGIRLALVNVTYGTNGIPVPEPYIVGHLDSSYIRKAIGRAREKDADIIIALPHWGDEYVTTPNKIQRRWEEFFYYCGADAVIGGHPHIIQPLVVREERITLYSMGNLISNMSREGTPLGLMLRIKIATEPIPHICDAEPIPVWCSRKGMFSEKYTILPVEQYMDKEELFLNKSDYRKMKETYLKYKKLFDKDAN